MPCEQFTCEKCEGHRLEEVMVNVTVSTEILDVGEGGDLVYGLASNEDGEVECYQCLECGHVLKDITNSEELAWYLGGKR